MRVDTYSVKNLIEITSSQYWIDRVRLHDLHDLEVKCRRKELKFSHFDGNVGTFHSFSAIILLNRQKLSSITANNICEYFDILTRSHEINCMANQLNN